MSTETSKPGNVVEMRAAETAAPGTIAETKVGARPSRRRRYLIMAALPIILAAVGGYFWLTGGRYVSTDNAYVQQDRVTLTAGVSGRIVEVAVHENQRVAAGDLLFRIDPQPYRIAVDAADAALASARLQVEQLRAGLEQAIAAATAARDDVGFKRKAFDRVKGLLAKGVSSQAAFDSAENDLHAAEQAASQAEQRIQAALAALGGDANIATDKHPTVLAASTRLEQARLDLANTEVRAPVSGIVSQTDRLQVGQYVANPTANPTALLAIVETGNTWVEANFKETDLTRMQPGRSATVSFDVFPGQEFSGEVESIGAGTGAEFSLLPAQNASGNWVKVVQRVPVRIRLSGDFSQTPLRSGLSAYVSVDLTSHGGGVMDAAAAAKN
jgi:membrane fusion protein (multidrug efflux system)